MAFCIDSLLDILKESLMEKVIDGISSNLANTFLFSRQIFIIKTGELGANTVGVISLCNS